MDKIYPVRTVPTDKIYLIGTVSMDNMNPVAPFPMFKNYNLARAIVKFWSIN